MSEHARLAPSAASRWMSCPGSITLSEKALELVGPQPQNDAAALGTALHEVAELCLLDGEQNFEDHVGKVYNGVRILADHEHRVQPYIDYCRELDGDHYVETRAKINEHCWGTADHSACQPGRLVVTDLKTGTGVKVFARYNPQLMLYALGSYLEYNPIYEFETFTIVVSQPALDHHDEFEFNLEDMEEFIIKVADATAAVFDDDPALNPSESACRWCPARPICPALEELTRVEALSDFKAMTAAEIGEALERIPMLKAWIAAIQDFAKELMLEGVEVPGKKVVEGRRRRAWIDPVATEKYLKSRVSAFVSTCYTKKLLTPAQMEKALKKATIRGKVDLDSLIGWSTGNPTIVDEDDAREALTPGSRAASDFEEVA